MEKKDRKINFKYNMKEYWNILIRYRGVFFLLLVIALLLQCLLIADKFLFKYVVDGGESFLGGSITENSFSSLLITIAFIYLGVVLFRVLTKWLLWYLTIYLDVRIEKDLKSRYFNHILGLSHKFHTTHKTGSLISRLGRGSRAIEAMSDILIFQFLPMIFNLVIVGFSLAYFSLAPAITIFVITFVFIAYSLYIQNIQQKYHLLVNEKYDSEKAMVGDVFTNVDSIKYFGKEKNIGKKFEKKIEETKKALWVNGKYYRIFDVGHLLILGIGGFFLLLFPILDFMAGDITLGTLVFIYTIYGNVVGPLFGFVWGMKGFYNSMADFQDLFEYSKHENEVKDKKGARNLKIRKGEIEFKDVDFDYGKNKLFRKFNLKIRESQKVALVGRSGCGKTSLVKLLYRLFDVHDGKVLIDGKDIRDFKKESLRNEMSIVPQECILFDDTIYNNIKFSKPNASRKEVMKAIRFARLDNIVKSFPDKENTIVGERGVKLSGGEKQRVSIARAILADKKVLVLDEATSSLDSETEYEIQQSLEKLMEGRTSIIIAHRLSTIMKADKIIVLERGKIVQTGKHRQLINQEGRYKKLWNLQKGGYIK